MQKTIYILGDADRVREKVEAAMFAHDLVRVSTFSRLLSNAVRFLVKELEERLGAQTVMAGGDDVLLTVNSGSYRIAVVRDVATRFAENTGCAMSFGVGPSIEFAYVNLRKAKATGVGIVESGVD